MAKPSLLIYLHGFNSSPQSHKANVMRRYCAQQRPDIRVEIPQIPNYPSDAAVLLSELAERYSHDYHIGLVGSSLGGYMAAWLNNQFGFKAVLVNPAVRPYELLLDYLGEQFNPYTHQRYLLEPCHIEQLRELDVPVIKEPQSLWLLQQEGDEILDYRQAVEKFHLCRQTVEPQGDHSFVDFERYPAEILEFLGL